MLNYFEVSRYENGDNFPTSYAFDTLEEAIEYADANGFRTISQIGGAWGEWEKCELCGNWCPAQDINEDKFCDLCEMTLEVEK